MSEQRRRWHISALLAVISSLAACSTGSQSTAASSSLVAGPPPTSSLASPSSTSPAVPLPTRPTTSTTARPETPSTAVWGRLACEGSADVVTHDRIWPVGFEVEVLIDATTEVFAVVDNVHTSYGLPLRSARRVTIRSLGRVEGRWHLELVDPIGDRVAGYASRIDPVNAIDRDETITLRYSVGPEGEIEFEAPTAVGLRAAYADFVLRTFGATLDDLAITGDQDERLVDLVAAGGFEMVDPFSADYRIANTLGILHAQFGAELVADSETDVSDTPWNSPLIAYPLTLESGTMTVTGQRGSCVSITTTGTLATDALGQGPVTDATAASSISIDASTGEVHGAGSRVRIVDADGVTFRATTAIQVLSWSDPAA